MAAKPNINPTRGAGVSGRDLCKGDVMLSIDGERKGVIRSVPMVDSTNDRVNFRLDDGLSEFDYMIRASRVVRIEIGRARS